MGTEIIIILLSSTLPGILLLLVQSVFYGRINNKSGLTHEEDDNLVLIYYISGTVGLWLVIFSLGFIIIKVSALSPDFFIMLGLIAGTISSIRSFNFWALSEDLSIKKQSPEEFMGGIGFGCIGVIIFPMIGVVSGYVMYLIFR